MELRAGPLRMQLEGGDLRYLCLGPHEVVRRLYVAVRDRQWNTVPPEISQLEVEQGTDTFRVTFTCRHVQDAIDFRWQAAITGAADGTVTYSMRGLAQSSFERNRIGICVLNPIDTCAGAPFRVTHPDGSVEEGVLPRLIAPHQPVIDIVKLAHPVDRTAQWNSSSRAMSSRWRISATGRMRPSRFTRLRCDCRSRCWSQAARRSARPSPCALFLGPGGPSPTSRMPSGS